MCITLSYLHLALHEPTHSITYIQSRKILADKSDNMNTKEEYPSEKLGNSFLTIMMLPMATVDIEC